MKNLIAILAALIVITLLGYFHYDACVQPKTAKRIFFLSQTRACQLPGLVYDWINEEQLTSSQK